MNSVAPFSDAARLMWGAWGAGAIAIAVIISSIGALNGWTLMMGQVPMAAAQDRLFPPAFGRLSGRGVPAVGIVISAVLATSLVAFQALGSPGVRAFYNLVVSLSTMAAVIPYAFCALAVGLVARVQRQRRRCRASAAVEIIAFVFSVFTVYGCGREGSPVRPAAALARNSGVRVAAPPHALIDYCTLGESKPCSSSQPWAATRC